MPATIVRNAAGLACEEVDGVLYPIEEANPVGQNNWHLALVVELYERLRFLLEGHPTAQVFCDMFIYWINGNGEKCLAPDLVVFPVIEEPERKRNVVRLWEEASMPVFVLEALSDSSEDNDLGTKWGVYQDEWRVPEYFVCDPTLAGQQVRGYRRVEGEYREIEADERGWVWSEELRVWFGADERGVMGVWDAEGRPVSRLEAAAWERNEALADLAAQIRRTKEAERHAEVERKRAEAEHRAAEAAQARIRELEAALGLHQNDREGPAAG